jgi:hypothetical protein
MGVRLEYIVENYYDRTKDGRLAVKPELEPSLQELFDQMPK